MAHSKYHKGNKFELLELKKGHTNLFLLMDGKPFLEVEDNEQNYYDLHLCFQALSYKKSTGMTVNTTMSKLESLVIWILKWWAENKDNYEPGAGQIPRFVGIAHELKPKLKDIQQYLP